MWPVQGVLPFQFSVQLLRWKKTCQHLEHPPLFFLKSLITRGETRFLLHNIPQWKHRCFSIVFYWHFKNIVEVLCKSVSETRLYILCKIQSKVLNAKLLKCIVKNPSTDLAPVFPGCVHTGSEPFKFRTWWFEVTSNWKTWRGTAAHSECQWKQEWQTAQQATRPRLLGQDLRDT